MHLVRDKKKEKLRFAKKQEGSKERETEMVKYTKTEKKIEVRVVY